MNTTNAPIANGRYNLGLLRKKEKKMGKKKHRTKQQERKRKLGENDPPV